jgi:hypothetical protein
MGAIYGPEAFATLPKLDDQHRSRQRLGAQSCPHRFLHP